MRKKVVAMGLAAMMAMSLAACSSGGSSTSTTAAGSSAEATTAAAAASSEESKKEEAKGDGKGYVVALCNYSIEMCIRDRALRYSQMPADAWRCGHTGNHRRH